MGILRAIVRFYFGLQALFLVAVPPAGIYAQYKSSFPSDENPLLVVATAVGLGTVMYGLPAWAWWCLRKRKASARKWALAASVQIILVGLVVVGISWWHGERGSRLFNHEILAGVAGLVAFSRKWEDAETPPPLPVQRIKGDGTSRITDHAAAVISIAGYIGGQWLWARWGAGHNIMEPGFLSGLVLLQIAVLVAIACHEAGHAVVGIRNGMVLRHWQVGPFSGKNTRGRWQFKFLPQAWYSGHVGLVPTSLENLGRRNAGMLLAGPVGSVTVGLTAWIGALWAAHTHLDFTWTFLSMLSVVGLVDFLVNLLPLKVGQNYSDGARIYHWWKQGPMEQLALAHGMVSSSLETGLRPRDWDMEILRKAASCAVAGEQAVAVRWYAVLHYRDKGQIDEATMAALSAQTYFERAQWSDPHDILSEFLFFDAVYRQNRESAEHWWGMIESLPGKEWDAERYLAKVAILWLRGHHDAAWDAWDAGYTLAMRLPACGAYEMTQKGFEVLREALTLDRSVFVPCDKLVEQRELMLQPARLY